MITMVIVITVKALFLRMLFRADCSALEHLPRPNKHETIGRSSHCWCQEILSCSRGIQHFVHSMFCTPSTSKYRQVQKTSGRQHPFGTCCPCRTSESQQPRSIDIEFKSTKQITYPTRSVAVEQLRPPYIHLPLSSTGVIYYQPKSCTIQVELPQIV